MTQPSHSIVQRSRATAEGDAGIFQDFTPGSVFSPDDAAVFLRHPSSPRSFFFFFFSNNVRESDPETAIDPAGDFIRPFSVDWSQVGMTIYCTSKQSDSAKVERARG